MRTLITSENREIFDCFCSFIHSLILYIHPSILFSHSLILFIHSLILCIQSLNLFIRSFILQVHQATQRTSDPSLPRSVTWQARQAARGLKVAQPLERATLLCAPHGEERHRGCLSLRAPPAGQPPGPGARSRRDSQCNSK